MKRQTKIMVRVSDEEKGVFESLARSKGLPLASWARSQLLESASNNENEHSELNSSDRCKMPLLSLFCGPGGLDEGFRQAGFKTVLASDIDSECVNTHRRNHPEARAFIGDISKLGVSDFDERLGEEIAPVGVLGGPPCQSFSVSNVHQSEDDPRHRLPESYAKLLAKLNSRKPISFFVFENVPGLLGKRHRERYEEFKQLFREAGFEIREELLNAKHYGVPQERPRIIIVGINQDLHPGKVWIPPARENDDSTIKTVKDTIYGLPEPVFNGPGLDPSTFDVHPNHWCLVPRSAKFKEARLEQGQMYGRSFRTLSWAEPSWTVAYGHREVHVHPNGHRRLSMYEALLLQSFPKEYVLTGNLSAQIRLVSEAVPPRLAWHIACSIRTSLGI